MSDWDNDLDLGPPPRYPIHLQNPLFVWDDQEEDLQTAALGWILTWRQQGDTLFIDETGKKCFLARPIPQDEDGLFRSLNGLILDWLWVQKGGAILDEIHNVLIQRHHIRLKETSCTRK